MIITPEKRNSLIKLGAVTIVVLIVIWMALIRPVQERVSKQAKERDGLEEVIAQKKEVIRRGEQAKERFDDVTRQLRRIEEQMVSGDTYLWIIKTLGDFEVPGRLEFTKYDPPRVVKSAVTAKLPYQTTSFVVTGIAAYHDLGRFLSRFENIYPHVRVNRVDMEPVAAGLDPDEKLSFLLEMHVLVKPGASQRSSGS